MNRINSSKTKKFTVIRTPKRIAIIDNENNEKVYEIQVGNLKKRFSKQATEEYSEIGKVASDSQNEEMDDTWCYCCYYDDEKEKMIISADERAFIFDEHELAEYKC